MRILFFIVFVFSSITSIGQNTNSSPVEQKQENNTLYYNSAPQSFQETNQLDTVRVKESENYQKVESTSKKAKAVTRNAEEAVKTDKNAAGSSAQKGAAVQSYSNVKIQSTYSRTQRTPTIEQQTQMNAALDQLEGSAPESFEFNFFKYQSGNYNTELIDYLNKAEKLKPNNSDVHIQKAAYHWTMSDSTSTGVYLKKLTSASRISSEMVDYSEDMLLSVPQNGTLITHGIEDTYGAMSNQFNSKSRKDVTIISLEVLQSPQMKSLLIKRGYKMPASKTIDVHFLKEFCQLNKTKGITISMTVPKEYLAGISDKLYVAGLVFEYKEEKGYNNFVRNDELWREKLKKKLINNVKTDKGRQLSANYLPMLLQLSKTYGDLNEPKKKNEVDEAMDKVAVQCNKYEQVKKLRSY